MAEAKQERTVEEIDRELASRVKRRKALREERETLKLRPFVEREKHEGELKVNQQRTDAQTEMIARLMEERAVAEAHIPDTLDEWLDQEGNPTR